MKVTGLVAGIKVKAAVFGTEIINRCSDYFRFWQFAKTRNRHTKLGRIQVQKEDQTGSNVCQ